MADAQSNGVPTRRLNTVVFVDIVGSTELAATLGDEGWAELLDGIFAGAGTASSLEQPRTRSRTDFAEPS